MFTSGMYVFPLVKMDQYMDGYFMDAAGNVFSNKTSRTGSLTKLTGSLTPSGRYYTLNKRTYRDDQLKRRAMNHALFTKEVHPHDVVKIAVAQGGLPVAIANDRSKRASTLLAAKGYVLATVSTTDKLIFGTDPMFHLDAHSAEAEAQRIAMLKPGTRVVLLQAVKSVVAGGVKWE